MKINIYKKENKSLQRLNTNEKEQYERCVCCGVQTSVAQNTDIEQRVFYIEGAGQLCGKCYYELYNR